MSDLLKQINNQRDKKHSFVDPLANKAPVVSTEPANPLMAEILSKRQLKSVKKIEQKPKPALNQMETMMMMIKGARRDSMKHVDRDEIEAVTH